MVGSASEPGLRSGRTEVLLRALWRLLLEEEELSSLGTVYPVTAFRFPCLLLLLMLLTEAEPIAPQRQINDKSFGLSKEDGHFFIAGSHFSIIALINCDFCPELLVL